jgi:hypothetical protein
VGNYYILNFTNYVIESLCVSHLSGTWATKSDHGA